MNKFSDKSLDRLKTCHEDLQALFLEVIKHFDCVIIEGHRDMETQNEYFRTGKSKLEWPNGKHNSIPSLAVDVAPVKNGKIDWNDRVQFYFFIGFVKGIASQMGIKIRSGGDWDGDNDLKDQTFIDLPHFELVVEGASNDNTE